jgi:high-affinity iron transporter
VTRLSSIIALVVALAGSALAAEPDGARIYAERCSGCHGDQGGGDGPAAAALVPRPKNFRDSRERTLAELVAFVKKGKTGTMMPPFDGVLTDAEMEAVSRVVQRFAAAAK